MAELPPFSLPAFEGDLDRILDGGDVIELLPRQLAILYASAEIRGPPLLSDSDVVRLTATLAQVSLAAAKQCAGLPSADMINLGLRSALGLLSFTQLAPAPDADMVASWIDQAAILTGELFVAGRCRRIAIRYSSAASPTSADQPHTLH